MILDPVQQKIYNMNELSFFSISLKYETEQAKFQLLTSAVESSAKCTGRSNCASPVIRILLSLILMEPIPVCSM